MLDLKEVINIPNTVQPNFKMINVGKKRPTRRKAIASGSIYMNPEALDAIKNDRLPKGNVLALAEAAGIIGAKKTPELIPMCHTLPLDQVTIDFTLNESNNSITAYAQAVAFAKTGVEMEALAGVNAALLTIWDLTKGIDPSLSIRDVQLLVKTGGKNGLWTNPNGIPNWLTHQLPDKQILANKKAAILVMSDRASAGTYEDQSGPILKALLEDAGAHIISTQVIADKQDTISTAIKKSCVQDKPDLLIASGGTGPGPKDVTPDALNQISDRMLEGLGDLLRTESLYFTDTAWLSRMTAGMVGATLVIALPGSPKAVAECWDIISPFIGDALNKIKQQGYGATS